MTRTHRHGVTANYIIRPFSENSSTMSAVLDFYRDAAPMPEGDTRESVLAWPDRDFAFEKTWVKWLFPTPADGLAPDDIAAFRADADLRRRLRLSAERYLAFLGLTLADGEVREAPNFAARHRAVWFHQNDNWQRVTRMITSLAILGEADLARLILSWLDVMYHNGRLGTCDPDSTKAIVAAHRSWVAAVTSPS